MTRRRAACVVALALAGFASSTLACTGDPVILASVEEADAGPPGKPPPRCVDAADCPAGTFCERRACGDPAGLCKPFPVSCATEERPVCGCDGVTYFNDCLRRAAGQTPLRPGECGVEALPCRSPSECPLGGACARLAGTSPMSCGPDPQGSCWLLPATCPAGQGADQWRDCAPPPPPGPPPPPPPPCLDTCAAIRSGRPHFRALSCD